jgi:8-oxo-dGTP pyrophosphatase MutT (NUDIX family)
MPDKPGYFHLKKDEHDQEYIQCGDGVWIVPLTDAGEVILSVEPSAAFGELVLIVGGGEVEPGETYASTANRELQEELGYKANRLDFLGELRLWSKYLTTRAFVFLARDLVESKLPGDEGYEIGKKTIRLSDLETLIISGQLVDAPSIAALYIARSFLNREKD